MISDADMKMIEPKQAVAAPSSAHVHAGLPMTKATRVRSFSPDEWEEFIEEWATALNDSYYRVRRFGGAGDSGVDIAGFCSPNGFEGAWDNYQCKRYDHPLRPSDIWVEIGKIVYYSFNQEYSTPRAHYFVASLGIGTRLEKLLNKPSELGTYFKSNWDTHCRKKITTTRTIELTGAFLTYVNAFDFSIFSSKSHIELIGAHSHTGFHAVRFGGGLQPRPEPDTPPDKPVITESRYIRQLLDAYGDHLQLAIESPAGLKAYQLLERDFLRQRERFYHAESLRNFARDTVPEGTFKDLQDELYHGVIDIAESGHTNGFERMRATVAQAAQVSTTANPLASVTKSQDRQGICHQLANDDRLTWVPADD